ncbi:hypothetical protein K474DRAFT_1746897, partial [Panus rudis PR-1116 ss-1]
MQFGSRLEPTQASYYSNLTGFWRGDLTFHNLTYFPEVENPPEWYRLASDYIAGGNLTNSTEVAERLGPWNWTASDKAAMGIGDKLIYSEPHLTNVSKDISIIHGKVDLTDSKSSEELRLDFDGVHFISNGSIYAFAEPNGKRTDIRLLPLFAPEHRMNETAGVVDAELRSHISRLKEKIESGDIESGSEDDDGPKTKCSFALFGQLEPSQVPQHLMKELEEEIDNPTGISTITPPPLLMKRSQSLYRKITTYAGFAAIANAILLVLLTGQVTRSSSAVGLARVSRHPFLAQSLIDAVSFVGHITLGILADGRPSIAVLAPAGFACLLFVREAASLFVNLILKANQFEEMRRPEDENELAGYDLTTHFRFPRNFLWRMSLKRRCATPEKNWRKRQKIQYFLRPFKLSAENRRILGGRSASADLDPDLVRRKIPKFQNGLWANIPRSFDFSDIFSNSPCSSVKFKGPKTWLRLHLLPRHNQRLPFTTIPTRQYFGYIGGNAFQHKLSSAATAYGPPPLLIPPHPNGPLCAFMDVDARGDFIAPALVHRKPIYRAVKRGRSSGLHPEYVIGATLCRLYYLLYFLACSKNILDVEPRRWVWLIALIMAVQ